MTTIVPTDAPSCDFREQRPVTKRRGRPPIGAVAMTDVERQQKARLKALSADRGTVPKNQQNHGSDELAARRRNLPGLVVGISKDLDATRVSDLETSPRDEAVRTGAGLPRRQIEELAKRTIDGGTVGPAGSFTLAQCVLALFRRVPDEIIEL